MQFPIHPHMLRHGCGYALANAGHDTRGRYRLGSGTRTSSTRCVTPSWLLIGLRTSGAENLSSRCRLELFAALLGATPRRAGQCSSRLRRSAGVRISDLTPKIVDQRGEPRLARRRAGELLGVFERGPEIPSVPAIADEGQQRVAVARMPGETRFENPHGIVDLPGRM